MKRNKIILTICAIAGAILAIFVAIAGANKPKHKHCLGDARTYYVSADNVYYTRSCTDGYTERFDTVIDFADVLLVANANDKIVLEEDLELTKIIRINSYISIDGQPQGRDININLDLNGHTITSNIDEANNVEYIRSMFILNSPFGSIDFKAKNGKLISNDLSYIINFSNNYDSGENINISLEDIECKVTGENVAPLFVNKSNYNSTFNATNCKFIAVKPDNTSINTGVGAFIYANSTFNFTNCEFEGGDGMYVKNGTINLDRCKLTSKQHIWQSGAEAVNSKFAPLGAALTVESYCKSSGCTKFVINIAGCEITSVNSSKTIYVAQTADSGVEKGFDANSAINVFSASFNKKPIMDAVVHYETEPVFINNLWVVG